MTVLMGLEARLRLARLYLCTDTRQQQGDLADFLRAAFAGGVDIVQIRQQNLSPEAELEALQIAREAAGPRGIVCVNHSPELAGTFAADMLHLGQSDGPARRARRHLHEWALVGRSTSAPEQTDEAVADRDLDYFCVGPVHATPTKPGAAPVGLDLVRHAARVAPVFSLGSKPWFAVGGIDSHTLDAVIEAGARRVCVVRAITEADDPEVAARQLRNRLQQAWRADPATERYALQVAASAPSYR